MLTWIRSFLNDEYFWDLPFCVMTSQCVYVVTHKTELRSNSSNNLPGFEYLHFCNYWSHYNEAFDFRYNIFRCFYLAHKSKQL